MKDFDIEFDISGIKAIKEAARKASTKHLRFGWLDGKKYPASHKNAGLYVAQVAQWQEYGTKNIPARPYAMLAFMKTKTTSLPLIQEYFKDVCNGVYNEGRLQEIAKDGKKNFKDGVMNQGFKALSATTIKIKGHSFQLDHTGFLLNNYDVKVYKTSVDKIDPRAL